MSLTIGIQADPLETLNHKTDSSLLLAYAASQKGHKLFFYTPADLSLLNGSLMAYGRWVHIKGIKHQYLFDIGEIEPFNLKETNIILLRQDPPFDLAYITSTYLLEHLPSSTLVVNNPTAVRNNPEKLLITHFPDLTPPTLITRCIKDAETFLKEHKKVIVKPLYHHGGKGIFLFKQEDPNLSSFLEYILEQSKEPFIIQKYLPEIEQGDKRLLLLNGKLIGHHIRIPKKGSIRANTSAGGTFQKVLLSSRDYKIIEQIGPFLKEKGLLFVGLDVIGSYVTEINVTSPTGLAHYNNLANTNLEDEVWQAIEETYYQK